MSIASHPTASSLEPSPEGTQITKDYFRALRVPYEAAALTALLSRRKPKSALVFACSSLADLGVKAAIPIIKELADFSVEDVKAASVLSVARLGGRTETPWLVECLSRKGTLKGYVLWALAAVADPAALPAVRAWFEPRLRELERRPNSDPRGNFMFAVAFLEQMDPCDVHVNSLLSRFRAVLPRIPDDHKFQLGRFTTTFASK